MAGKKKSGRPIRGKGKGKMVSQAESTEPPRSPSPPPTHQAQPQEAEPEPTEEESPQTQRGTSRASSPSASVASSSQSRSHSPSTQPQKKAKTYTDLTVAQEENLASWLEENEVIYNKKLTAYKDFRKKDALWDSQAARMNKDVAILKTWYRSIRTRYTRLVHKKSGDGASDLTERDRWILHNFAWLKVHVVEAKRKTTVSVSRGAYSLNANLSVIRNKSFSFRLKCV